METQTLYKVQVAEIHAAKFSRTNEKTSQSIAANRARPLAGVFLLQMTVNVPAVLPSYMKRVALLLLDGSENLFFTLEAIEHTVGLDSQVMTIEAHGIPEVTKKRIERILRQKNCARAVEP